MLEFCKKELEKQNNLIFSLINAPNTNEMKQLSQLITNQKILLESLILEFENPSITESPMVTQTSLKVYYKNYFQQQKILTAMGLNNFLANLNHLQINQENNEIQEFRNPPQESIVSNDLISSFIVPSPQSTLQWSSSKSSTFFVSSEEQPLGASLQNKPTTALGNSAVWQNNIGLQEPVNTSKKQEKARAAANRFRTRQSELAQNLTNKVEALQIEEQELKNQIQELSMENKELYKKQQFLRSFLMNGLTNKNNPDTKTEGIPFVLSKTF